MSLNIVHISLTNTAYAPARFVHLINKYTEHRAYLLQAKNFIFGNPLGLVTPRTVEEITDILDRADVLHFHGNQVFDRRRYLGIKIETYYKKPYVVHYHGTPQRERPFRFQRAVPLLVSTPEMLPIFNGSKYFPNLIDETHPMYINRRAFADGDTLRVCHHFSLHQRLKNTNWFERARDVFSRNGHKLDFVFLDQMPLDQALKARAENDIVFDHLQGYYGFVSIEALAQGIMVINGVDKQVEGALKDFFGSMPPFYVVRKKTFIDDFKRITPDTVADFASRGKRYIDTTWSGKANIERLIEFYRTL